MGSNLIYPQPTAKQAVKFGALSYSPELFSGGNGYTSPFGYENQLREYGLVDPSTAGHLADMPGLSSFPTQQISHKLKFDDYFYSRVQCKNEIDRFKQEDPEKHSA